MRVSCDVLDVPGGGRAVPSTARPVKAFLSLGTLKGGREKVPHLQINTANKKQQCYALDRQDVVESVVDRFIHQGRLTIHLRAPPRTILISKANPEGLRNLLSSLEAIAKGKKMEEVNTVKLADFVSRPQSMRIGKRNEYPTTTGFPSSLLSLSMNSIGLQRVDSRWFACSSLTSLDLSENLLGKASDLPKLKLLSRLSNLQLLNLASNSLRSISEEMAMALPPSLLSLSLARNEFSVLPSSLFPRLSLLQMLDASHNLLTSLPDSLRKMPRLSIVVEHNKLDFLPYLPSAIRRTLRVAGNPLTRVRNEPHLFPANPACLSALAAKSVSSWTELPLELPPYWPSLYVLPLLSECVFCLDLFPRSLLLHYIRVLPGSRFAQEVSYNLDIPVSLRACRRCFLRRPVDP